MRRLASIVACLALAGICGAADPGNSESAVAGPLCDAPPALVSLGVPLAQTAARVAETRKLTIVAVGSSSTRGVGASAPGYTYPSRLEAELQQRLPGVAVRVLNRGSSGEDAPEEFARLGRDVIAEHPDLVIWQVGTNAVLRRDDIAADDALIARGVRQLQQSGADVVLMDLQYAPRVLARSLYRAMEDAIANEAKRSRVGLFRRFAVMRYWYEAEAEEPPGVDAMVGPDGLHMSDRGYACLAADLAESLTHNLQQTAAAAGSSVRQAAAGRAGSLP